VAARERVTAVAALGREVVFEAVSAADVGERLGPTVRRSDELVELWALADPRDVRVPFSPEELELFAVQHVARRHEGYAGPGWDPAWVVISGGVSGDPVIGDTSRPGTPVMVALRGTGSWRPRDVAPDPAQLQDS
jgi:hypothetical protein